MRQDEGAFARLRPPRFFLPRPRFSLSLSTTESLEQDRQRGVRERANHDIRFGFTSD